MHIPQKARWIAGSALMLLVLGVSSCKVAEKAPTITKVTPGWGLSDSTMTLIIEGTNFKTDIEATLSKSGLADIATTALTRNSDKMLTAVFNLSGASVGARDVTVKNGDGNTATLADGFSVLRKTTLYAAEAYGGRISIFSSGDTVSGAATSEGVLTTGQLNAPFGLCVDASRDILYIANRGNNKILAFSNASTVNGSTAPNRVITSLLPLRSPYGICLDKGRDELYVTSPDTNTILVLASASSANGAVTPSRSIASSAFANPVGLYLDQVNNRLSVANCVQSGSVVPTRYITSPELSPWLYGVFVDISRKILYAVVATNGRRLLVFTNSDQISGAAGQRCRRGPSPT